MPTDLLDSTPMETTRSRVLLPRRSLVSAWLESALCPGVIALLLFGPLAFGAVQPWAIFVIEAGAGALFLLWVVQQALSGTLRVQSSASSWPILVFGTLIGLQLVFHTTAYWLATLHEAQLYIAYGIILFLAIHVFRSKQNRQRLSLILTGFAFLLAVFAIIQDFSAYGRIYWVIRPTEPSWPYGPYVNHNHYAGLMEMLIPIPLVMFSRGNLESHRRILTGFAAVVMITSLFLSRSRGGVVAFAIEVLVLVVVFGTSHGRVALARVGVLILICLAMLAWLGKGALWQRLATVQHTSGAQLSGDRITIAKDSLKLIAQKPLLGWGLGLFPSVYPSVRSFPTDQFINEAHNDFIQLLVETGLTGFACVVAFLFLVYRSAIRNLRGWQFDDYRSLTLAVMIGISGILVHSFVDFNLQIPANAVMFFFYCGIAATPSCGTEVERSSHY